MITHEIRKPVQETYFSRRSQQQQHPAAWQFGAPAPQRPHRAPIHLGNVGGQQSRLYMDKIEYAKWVEGPEVKGKFHEGQLVTIASAVYVPDRAPSIIFLVDHIQEICFMAPMCLDSKQPKCIGIKHDMASSVVTYPPCKLRPLNEEELKLVHLRNQKAGGGPAVTDGDAQGKAEEAKATTATATKRRYRTTILGGAVVNVDADTGEIIDEDNEGYSG